MKTIFSKDKKATVAVADRNGVLRIVNVLKSGKLVVVYTKNVVPDSVTKNSNKASLFQSLLDDGRLVLGGIEWLKCLKIAN